MYHFCIKILGIWHRKVNWAEDEIIKQPSFLILLVHICLSTHQFICTVWILYEIIYFQFFVDPDLGHNLSFLFRFSIKVDGCCVKNRSPIAFSSHNSVGYYSLSSLNSTEEEEELYSDPLGTHSVVLWFDPYQQLSLSYYSLHILLLRLLQLLPLSS